VASDFTAVVLVLRWQLLGGGIVNGRGLGDGWTCLPLWELFLFLFSEVDTVACL
jgi:hypothetical protein